MDNLTHSLAGVILSRAGFNRLTPASGWLMILAANVPDFDIVTGWHDSVRYLECHRGWTHALPWSPLVALAPLALWWLMVRKSRPGRAAWAGAYAASLAGVWSHCLLDWLNVYGIRLLLPQSGAWFRLDLLYIVDVWVWALGAIALLAPALAKLVSQEIGSRTRKPARGWAWFALCAFAAYLAVRVSLHDRAILALDSRIHAGRNPRRTAAFPTPFLPWKWVGVAETEDFYRVYQMDVNREFDPDQGRTLYRSAEQDPAIEIARATRTMKGFLSFAQFPFWELTPAPDNSGGLIVRVTDLRFGMPEEGRFRATVKLNAARQVTAEAFEFGTLPSPAPAPQ